VKASIGSQIACRLCLEHFVEGTLDYHEQPEQFGAEQASMSALEAAFKRANSAVYEFGHKLAAGGRLAAALIALVIEEGVVSAGRVGAMSAYLHRNSQLHPFFEGCGDGSSFVGSNSIVTIETASADIVGGDLILLFSRLLDSRQERLVIDLIGRCALRRGAFGLNIVPRLFDDAEELEFCMLASLGPEAIYLSQEV